MLDIGAIKRIHESDEQILDMPFSSKQLAVLMFEQAHHHRGLLLAEVERLRTLVDKLETRIDALETTGKILVA